MKLTTKRILASAILIVTLSLVALPMVASAETAGNLFDVNNARFDLGNRSLKSSVNAIIKVLLGFLGIIAVIIVLYGGFIWMTAMGDEDKTKKAKDLIIAGIVGIIIILAAYAIAEFVISNIGNATGLEDTPAT